MGQAKQRGSYEERVAEAIVRDAEKPQGKTQYMRELSYRDSVSVHNVQSMQQALKEAGSKYSGGI